MEDIRYKVLIVDDEQQARDSIQKILKPHFEVLLAKSGVEGIAIALEQAPDSILLDLSMPRMDGLEACRILQTEAETRDIPVIVMTSAPNDDEKRAKAFMIGAADVVSKPVRPKEFLARVTARIRQFNALKRTESVLKCGNLTLDLHRFTATLKGRKQVHLSSLEFKLLSFLIRNEGQIFDRETILRNIWKHREVSSERIVDNHISTLRRKLKGFDYRFVAVYGAGYGIKKNDE